MIAPYVLFFSIAATLLIDAWLYLRSGYQATITAWIVESPSRAGLVGVLIGMLIGHLFL